MRDHMNSVSRREIAEFLHTELNGDDGIVRGPADLENSGPADIVWIKKYSIERVDILNSRQPGLVICDTETGNSIRCPWIHSNKPRLDFIKILNHFFSSPKPSAIHPTAIIEKGAAIGRDVSIGAFARIGSNVSVGDGCVIGSGVALEGPITIGKYCTIKANSALGGEGFGFELDENNIPLHFPHIGSISLGDNVWIGACSTIERATLGTTMIEQDVKIDDHAQIGHNCYVGQGTLIMAGVILCGGAKIGMTCWIAPNSVIKEKVRIGNNVTVGLSSVVLRDIPDGITVAGVPARPLNKQTQK